MHSLYRFSLCTKWLLPRCCYAMTSYLLQDTVTTASISLTALIAGSVFASTLNAWRIEVPELTATAVSQTHAARHYFSLTELCTLQCMLSNFSVIWLFVMHKAGDTCTPSSLDPEEVRHASRNADSACPFLPSRQYKKGHAESALHDACRTSVL